MASTFVLGFFPLLMVIAGIGDFFTLRIPNWLNGLIAAAAPVMAAALAMPLDIMGLHGAAGFIMLLAGMALFFAGQIGGGDAKLMAAAGLWVGLDPLLPFAVYTALAGGVLAVIMYGGNRLLTAGELSLSNAVRASVTTASTAMTAATAKRRALACARRRSALRRAA